MHAIALQVAALRSLTKLAALSQELSLSYSLVIATILEPVTRSSDTATASVSNLKPVVCCSDGAITSASNLLSLRKSPTTSPGTPEEHPDRVTHLSEADATTASLMPSTTQSATANTEISNPAMTAASLLPTIRKSTTASAENPEELSEPLLLEAVRAAVGLIASYPLVHGDLIKILAEALQHALGERLRIQFNGTITVSQDGSETDRFCKHGVDPEGGTSGSSRSRHYVSVLHCKVWWWH